MSNTLYWQLLAVIASGIFVGETMTYILTSLIRGKFRD